MSKKVKLSALDLANVIAGGNAASAIARTVELAQQIEQLGYTRLWLAEHHNMEYIASSATAVLIGHVAAHTRQIRIGSGGVMLPNHAPLAVAEQFGTLETMYPGRIDLGLGRAPGTDQLTAMALRRNNPNAVYHFPEDVRELQQYFSDDNVSGRVRAFPGEGLDIPIWILGSSTDSAYLAAEMGLPYAFAAHFAPRQFRNAIALYRAHFKPSAQLAQPYVMACVNVLAADTDQEADLLASSLYNMFLGVITNTRKPLQPPVADVRAYWPTDIRAAVDQMLACTFTGSPDSLRPQLEKFIEETGIDELMTTGYIYDSGARLKSFRLLKEVLG
ncbi:LLM class flavin-dependent oxidoreductase [Parapedobacter lycopersici]|uniref:LLM class flavin-dependent oxidoreductase n=1 Tax=Parapedobacter lycopersici TaxID=1864939 RepID=UPI00333E414F